MEKYKMDFSTMTLTITKAFEDKAAKPFTAENKILVKFQKDFPNLTIVRKTHRSPAKYRSKSGDVYSCNQFKNLTYENMERFMDTLPEGESREEVKKAYIFLRYDAGLVQTSTYRIVREWFVQQFPEYRKDPLFYLYNEVVIINLKPFLDQQKKQEAKKNQVAELTK